MATLGRQGVTAHCLKLRDRSLTLVAERIDTHDDLRIARDAGVNLFQGRYLSIPELRRRHEAVASRIAMLQLASALQNPDVDLAELERLIGADVALCPTGC